MARRKLILKNFQSPGDLVMLTAAVRDLHRGNPREFITDVRTPCPHLWENNPHVTPIKDDDTEAEQIQCDYPLIHKSNTQPWHFIHGFHQFLSTHLKVNISPTDFRGDIHLSKEEKSWISQVQEITKEEVPFWIIAAGGKLDFTIKWWDIHRFQKVVDNLRGRVFFVQVGEMGHHHPALRGVLDLRGKTDLRQVIRLMYQTPSLPNARPRSDRLRCGGRESKFLRIYSTAMGWLCKFYHMLNSPTSRTGIFELLLTHDQRVGSRIVPHFPVGVEKWRPDCPS